MKSESVDDSKLPDDLFERLVETLPNDLMIFDSEGRFIYCNEVALVNVNIDTRALRGKTPSESGFPVYFSKAAESAVHKAFATDSPQTARLQHVTDGKSLTFEITVTPIMANSKGTEKYGVAIARDITEFTTDQLNLKQSSMALNAISAAFCVTNPNEPDNPIVYVNSTFEQITGYTLDEVRGKNCRFLQSGDSDQDGVRQLREAIDKVQPVTARLRNYRKDGTLFHSEVVLRPIFDANNNLSQFIGVQRDITHQVDAERDHASATERLECELSGALKLSNQLQHALLITADAPKIAGADMAFAYQPAAQNLSIGGDFYDVMRLSDHETMFVLGDASGSGLSAALRTVEVKFSLRAYVREHQQPEVAIGWLNQVIVNGTQSGGLDTWLAFTTLIAMSYNARTRKLVYVHAGGSPPYLVHTQTDTQQAVAHMLPSNNAPVGVRGDEHYERFEYDIYPGDTLVCFTDGVSEARNITGPREFFEHEALPAYVTNHVQNARLQSIPEALLGAAQTYSNNNLRDDACVLVVRFD